METERPMRIFCKANTNLNAACRGDKVILVRQDSSDKSQHWILDYDVVGRVTDDQGRRAFALVNRATGQALVQAVVNKWYKIKLAPYRGRERVELSMLWSLGPQLAGGFSEVRLLNNLQATLNALGGGVPKEENDVGIFNSEPEYNHAIWKIIPIAGGFSGQVRHQLASLGTMETERPMRIFCKANTNLNAACRGDKVILVPEDSSDKSQHWIQDYSAVGKLTDEKGSRAFALVNRTTGQALVNGDWEGEVQLAPYSGHVSVELSTLWSLGVQHSDGFSEVKVLQNGHRQLNALGGEPIGEGKVVGIYRPQSYNHALWKIVPVSDE